jgi:Tol biopolymer transport system component
MRLLVSFGAMLLLTGSLAAGAGAGSGQARSVPSWASHGFIVFKYLDSLAQMRPGSESGGILVGGPAWDPALSPNGRFLAFRGYYRPFAEGNYALYALNLRHGTRRRLTRSIAGDPSWSPDGRWLVYDTSGAGEIWKVRASGGKPVRLTRRDGLGDWSPTWAPSGRLIAFEHGATDRSG